MSKFGIMLYLVSNLAPCIAFVKFNVKFSIALEMTFYVNMPNFGIDSQIWHYIGDALTYTKIGCNPSTQQNEHAFKVLLIQQNTFTDKSTPSIL